MSLVFKEILITDIKNKLSKKIVFSSKTNLITSSENSRGKSIVLKSLYHTLGANSHFDSSFNKDDILFDLKFTFNNRDFRIARLKNDYTIFSNGKLINSIKYGNIQQLSEFYKNNLEMFVYLKDRNSITGMAPPAYLFVPYYLDQDVSWKKEQEPFEKMAQYEKLSRNDLYYYHLGIFSDSYFEIDNKIKKCNETLNKIRQELRTKDSLYLDLRKELNSDVVVNINELDIELRNLNITMTEQVDKVESLKNKIYERENEKIALQFLIEEIDNTLNQLNKEKTNDTKHVACPNCAYEFDVNLKDEVELLYNKEFLKNRKEKALLDIDKITSEVVDYKNELNKHLDNIQSIKDKIFKKENNYKKYLNREVIKDLLETKTKEIALLEEECQKYELESKRLQLEIESLDEKKIKVGPTFKQYYKSNLLALGVDCFDETKIKPFYKLPISGSLYVRSTLAFYYGFLDTKAKFTKTKFMCPLVIDSPREGEQDDINSSLILDYIFSRNVGDYQLIVASVDAEKYINAEILNENQVKVIKISGEKNRLLNKEEYLLNQHEIENLKSYFI